MKNLERGNGHASGKSVGRSKSKEIPPGVYHGGTATTAEVPSRVQGFSEKREKKEKRETDYYKNLYYANKLNMEFTGLKNLGKRKDRIAFNHLKDFIRAYITYSL